MEDFIKKVLGWDVVSWYPALRKWEEILTARPAEGKALELGGNKGGVSLWLARKGFDVVCSDLQSPEPLAAPLHMEFGIAEHIEYRAIDATDIPYEDHFDVIAFKSILGGIGRDGRSDLQQKAIGQAYKALKKGGVLLFAENMTGSPLHRLFRKKFVQWGSSWRYVTKNEMKVLLSPFDAFELKTTGFSGTFGRSEAQRRALGHADRLLFNALLPSGWHYICYGWARK